MSRVILHWTAGAHQASSLDREHYHVLVEGDGTVVYGTHPIDTNAKPAHEPRASHTRNLNTGSIGVAVCCMKDAKERPFSAGPFPMTQQQWQVAEEVVAELCARYRIDVTPRSVLAHGEVQATLNVEQMQKWDPLVLPWSPSLPRQQVMDQFRASVRDRLTTQPPPTAGAPASTGSSGFEPQSLTWTGDRAVLLVHGVGNAKPGDYTDVQQAVRAAAGPDVAIYSLFYDVFNDWFSEKTQVASQVKRLMAFIKAQQGDSKLADTVAEFAGDVVWPLFALGSRAAVARAYLAQLKQMVLDGTEDGRLLSRELKLSIVCHSLGCFHTYEALHTIAAEKAHMLRPATDGVRFQSVVFMASPVQLIRTLAQKAGVLVPSGLATVAGAELRIPFEQAFSTTTRSVDHWVSVAGDLDPVGGHILRRKEDWAYMKVADSDATYIVDPQQLVGGGIDEDKLFTLLKTALSSGKPPSLSLENPHSWLAYIQRHEEDLRTWLA